MTDAIQSERAGVGKIARLPKHIRQQLNRRLEDNQPSDTVLPWLNALPSVQKILAAQFNGAPISHQNLSNWTATGFRRWQQKQEPLALIAELGEDAADFSSAAGARIARGAAAIAAAQILDFLKSIPKNKRSPRHALQAANAITALIKADQNNVRLKLAKRKVRQKDAQLLLMRDKHQRDAIAIGLRLIKDERARRIEAMPVSYAEKKELLGRHTFGKHWLPRPIPAPPALPSAPR
jgi:hypothetical protein